MSITTAALLQGVLESSAIEHAGPSLRIEVREACTLVWTPLPFDAEPLELSLGLRGLLGKALDAHNDRRGVFVFPDRVKPKGKTYDALLDEVGELGQWVKKASQEEFQAAMAGGDEADEDGEEPVSGDGEDGEMAALSGLMNQLSGMLSAIPPDALAAMQNMMLSGGGPQNMDPAALQNQLSQALGGEDKLMELQNSLLGSLGQMDPKVLESLSSKANDQLDAIRKQDPLFVDSLASQFGAGTKKPKR